MLFHSWQFAVFLPIVVVLYFLLPHKYRCYWLLAASYYFYISWNAKLIVLIAGTTFVTWLAAYLLDRQEAGSRRRKLCLAFGVSVPLAILFFFKYFNFSADLACAVLQRLSLPIEHRTLDVLLPVGISFYTFQALSYVIDVYRGDLKAEKRIAYYALYISFFPQLVAGPIERSTNLLPQFDEKHSFDYDNAAYGLKLIALGFFKKLVIADTVSVLVDRIYNHLPDHAGLSLILATVLFAMQIYCDFSGYSDIAVGSARLIGFRLMKNFDSPYFSRSIKEFWKRWHISLSTWFMDYVYIPLGGNRVRIPRYYLNLLITFTVSGLWHGANLTFVAWGLVHGIYMVVGAATRRFRNQLLARCHISRDAWWMRAVSVCITFLLVCTAWVFFRANQLSDAAYIFAHAFDEIQTPLYYLRSGYRGIGMNKALLTQLLLTLGILASIDIVQLKADPIVQLSRRPVPVRWIVYVLFLVLIIVLPDKGIPAQFIYFQF